MFFYFLSQYDYTSMCINENRNGINQYILWKDSQFEGSETF